MRWVVGVGLLAEAGAFSMILPSNRQQVVSSPTSSISYAGLNQRATSRAVLAGGSSRHGRYKTNLRTTCCYDFFARGSLLSRMCLCDSRPRSRATGSEVFWLLL